MLQLVVLMASLQMADGFPDVIWNLEETVGTFPLQYVGLLLVVGFLMVILLHMMPGGPQAAQEPDEEQQSFAVVEGQAHYIMVEAQAAVAARDVDR